MSVSPSLRSIDFLPSPVPDPGVADWSLDSPAAEAPQRELSPADRKLRLINLVAVVLPFAGILLTMLLCWGGAFNWTQFLIFSGFAYATAIGVTVGYHRLFTHKSFTTGPVVRYTLAILGSMAAQGPVIEWAGTHRRHHQHSDDEGDPHSPHCHADGSWGEGVRGMLRGAWHSHIGWLFAGRPKGLGKYTKDLRADRVIMAANRQFPLWVLAGLLIPALLGGLITMSFTGALLGFVWGGLARVFIVHHITWSVNSVCHLWGSSPFRSGDESRNNVVVGVLGLGEGWHNNHHAFPTSARHGLRWWEFDQAYIIIRGLELVGLASKVRVPDAERIKSKRKPRHR